MIERTVLGPGHTISRLIKGGWHLAGGHGTVDRAQAIRDMAAFVDNGITTFDCADIYTGVEALIGDFLRAYPAMRDQVRVHTKFVPDLDSLATLDRAGVARIIDRSLRRLGAERLDLVQFHWWDWSIPGWVEVAQMLDELRVAGKIAGLAVTNFDTPHLAALLEAGLPIIANQVQYSVIDRRPEHGMVELCARYGVHLLCYGTLAGGFLGEDWLDQPEPQILENRSHIKYKLIIDEMGGWSSFQRLLVALKSVAEARGATIGQVAMRWALYRPRVVAAIVGATSVRHLAENAKLPTLRLSSADLTTIEAAMAQASGPKGDCFELERDRGGRHGRIMKYNLNVADV